MCVSSRPGPPPSKGARKSLSGACPGTLFRRGDMHAVPVGRRRLAAKMVDAEAVEVCERFQVDLGQSASRQVDDGLLCGLPGLEAVRGPEVGHDLHRTADAFVIHTCRYA